ncbi:hypothetical protein SUGI_0621240 [Cryptomeria japonica]|uniref:stigma-specific STIG1-like protein 2 n=1 Tax=Cryptomeria japonica TaxID=3369 RepID=UPI002414CF16|nr:stigma-specific STIG1-like protein 2 [Cryptomeria japonica]GLJ31044.1 hypothetical protein SUGI_0621240 [Cryptomeria japonica]
MGAMARMVAMALIMFAVMISNVGGDMKMVNGYPRKAILSRFLADKGVAPAPSPYPAKSYSCSAHKSVCKQNNIAGEVKSKCCKDRCVNVLTDRYHCGSCDKSCPFGYGCCKGKCVNVAYDKKNCGSCGVVCSKKGKCVYGMCSYA